MSSTNISGHHDASASYFGEITHNPGGGLVRLRPRAFDRALGELWRTGTPIPESFVRRPRVTPDL